MADRRQVAIAARPLPGEHLPGRKGRAWGYKKGKTDMRTSTVFSQLICAAMLIAYSSPGIAQSNSDTASAKLQETGKDRDGSHDFDFIVGNWKSHHRRLRNPLTGSNTWVEFDGTSVGKTLWDGRVSEDESVFNDPAGRIEGLTVRFYNQKTHQWSIYWASNTLGGLALPPVVGSSTSRMAAASSSIRSLSRTG